MSKSMKWIGLFAILVTVLVVPIYSWMEPARQDEILTTQKIDSVMNATDQYAENCAVCHGASGEGIAGNPPLGNPAVQSMAETDLLKVISRGRYNTLMAAWSVEEGGILSNKQVADLITLIQYGNWDYVEQRVVELGLTPPDMIEFKVTEEMLILLEQIPGGEALSEGFMLYAENCAACHAPNGSGTLIAPAIDSAEIRSSTQADLTRIITDGVPGTLMSGWQQTLTPAQIDSLVKLIYGWPDLLSAGVEFPEVENLSYPSSPEMIADGGGLFDIACKSCHGVDAYGTPMAPALNNQLFLTETPDAAIYQIIAGGIPGSLMPAWGTRLSDYDLQTLVAYLRNFESTAPAIVPPIIEP